MDRQVRDCAPRGGLSAVRIRAEWNPMEEDLDLLIRYSFSTIANSWWPMANVHLPLSLLRLLSVDGNSFVNILNEKSELNLINQKYKNDDLECKIVFLFGNHFKREFWKSTFWVPIPTRLEAFDSPSWNRRGRILRGPISSTRSTLSASSDPKRYIMAYGPHGKIVEIVGRTYMAMSCTPSKLRCRRFGGNSLKRNKMRKKKRMISAFSISYAHWQWIISFCTI